MTDTAKSLAALGHPARFEMVRRLADADENGIHSGVLAEELGLPHTTASSHLSVLLKAGIVAKVFRAERGYYGLVRGHVSSLGATLNGLAGT